MWRGLRKLPIIPSQKRGRDLENVCLMAPVKWGCAAVPSTATQAKDTGRVCGSPSPAQHGATSETPKLVYLMALCAVTAQGCGTQAWLCAGAPLPVPQVQSCRDTAVQLAQAVSTSCRDHEAPAWHKEPARGSPGSL